MVDKNTFMETLHAVQEIAKTSDQPMDKETALAYFRGMELTREQEELVYQFLMLPQSEAEPESEVQTDADGESRQETVKEEERVQKQSETAAENSTSHFQMYLDELEEITELAEEAEEKLYQKLLAGDTSVMDEIATQWLKRVITLAEEYQGRGSLLDDLVQEGNIGLLMELNALAGSRGTGNAIQQRSAESIQQRLKEAVKNAMEQYLGEESGEDQQNETILGKVSLVHQAREFLTKEKGEVPSLHELSEYTRIPAEEISDILSLIKENRRT